MSPVLEQESLRLEKMFVNGYEAIYKVTDSRVGLKAIIAIHNTTLGPAIGGTRIYPYETFQEALFDVLRLSKGMTYKSSIAQVAMGGGKSVIIADPKEKTAAMLCSFAKAVDLLKGQYICAEDSGSTPSDMQLISNITPFVTGLAGEKGSGDPSPFTAWGTFRGIQATLKKLFGSDSLSEKTVAVQGLGNVGSRLAEILFWAGAKLVLCDINQNKAEQMAKKFGAKTCSPDEILSVECDILAPCALGGIINAKTIPNLRCKAIAGSANNQLLNDQDADLLMKRGILYAVDFVINSGGLYNCVAELHPEGYNSATVRKEIHKIYDQLLNVYKVAEQNGSSTHQAANALAEYRVKYGVGKRTEDNPVYFPAAKLK